MNRHLKMFFRTVQTSFPVLLDAKFAFMRAYRNARSVPFDRDFDGIRLFPDYERALFLDVGGNRGQSTDAILMTTRNSTIQLFEPNPLLCDKLRRQFGAQQRVTINEFGLGNSTSTQPLHVPFYKNWMFDGLASFDRDSARGWLEGRVFFYNEKHVSLRQVPCTIRRLDDLGLTPFFVKLDVQGYEYEVIRGGEKTIRTHQPVLLVEAPPEENVRDFLKSLGYSFYTFKDDKFIGGIIESNNTFFMTEQRAALVREHIIA